MRRLLTIRIPAILRVGLAMLVTVAHAADKTWDGGGNGFSWSTDNGTPHKGNWVGDTAFVNGDNVVFAGTVGLIPTIANNSLTVGSVGFSNNAGAFLISGSAALTINNGVVNNSANAQTFNVTTILLGAAQAWDAGATVGGSLSFDSSIDNQGFLLTVTGGNDTLINGAISGSGGLLKNGTGSLTLNGNNSYSGLTTIGSGIIRLGSATALGNNTGGTLINVGGALNLNGQSVVGEAITLNGSGVSSGGALFNGSGTAASLSGPITLATSASFGGSGDLALSGVISGPGNSLTKVGNGTATLSGNNTFTGGLNVNAGILQVGSAGALNSTTPNAVAVSSGAKLRLNGNNVTVSGLTGAGTVENSHATTAATLSVNKPSGSDTFSGVIQNGGAAALALNKTGAGTLVLSGGNTYTGGTTLTEGNLELGADNALGGLSSGLTLAGGVLEANNHSVNMGILLLIADSILNLEDGGAPSALTFSSAQWTGGLLTINGWSGDLAIANDDDGIFFTAPPAFDSDFVSHVRFNVDDQLYFATMSGNELVPSLAPVPEPIEWALLIFATLAVLYKFAWPRLRARCHFPPTFRALH